MLHSSTCSAVRTDFLKPTGLKRHELRPLFLLYCVSEIVCALATLGRHISIVRRMSCYSLSKSVFALQHSPASAITRATAHPAASGGEESPRSESRGFVRCILARNRTARCQTVRCTYGSASAGRVKNTPAVTRVGFLRPDVCWMSGPLPGGAIRATGDIGAHHFFFCTLYFQDAASFRAHWQ